MISKIKHDTGFENKSQTTMNDFKNKLAVSITIKYFQDTLPFGLCSLFSP